MRLDSKQSIVKVPRARFVSSHFIGLVLLAFALVLIFSCPPWSLKVVIARRHHACPT